MFYTTEARTDLWFDYVNFSRQGRHQVDASVEGIAFHSGVDAFYVLDKPKVPYL
jgi:hypothetical protein